MPAQGTQGTEGSSECSPDVYLTRHPPSTRGWPPGGPKPCNRVIVGQELAIPCWAANRLLRSWDARPGHRIAIVPPCGGVASMPGILAQWVLFRAAWRYPSSQPKSHIAWSKRYWQPSRFRCREPWSDQTGNGSSRLSHFPCSPHTLRQACQQYQYFFKNNILKYPAERTDALGPVIRQEKTGERPALRRQSATTIRTR